VCALFADTDLIPWGWINRAAVSESVARDLSGHSPGLTGLNREHVDLLVSNTILQQETNQLVGLVTDNELIFARFKPGQSLVRSKVAVVFIQMNRGNTISGFRRCCITDARCPMPAGLQRGKMLWPGCVKSCL
jgi:hypothetical protein